MNQEFLSYAFSMFAALFPIANPVGAVPIFYSMTATDSKSYRQRQAQQTALNVFLVLVVFFIAGKLVLSFFGISLGIRIMGKNGIGAMNRILGFFILGIAVELIANGTLAFIRQSAPELLKPP